MTYPQYIDYPVETNPSILLQRVYDFLEASVPGWTPAEGNLDVWLAEAFSTEVSELTGVASAVPESIFRYFGSSLMGIQPIDATAAAADTTWTVRDNTGYVIPAGTQVGIYDAVGNLIAFETVDILTIAPGATTGIMGIVAAEPGANGSGLGSAGTVLRLLDILDYVSGVTLVATTVGGQDAETDADYLNRLSAQLRLLTRTPILPNDFSALAITIPPTYRAAAMDGYNPYHNLLTANQASIETDATGWANAANATLARSTAQATDGVASLSMTATGAGNMSAITNPITTVAVTPNTTVTGRAALRSAATGRTCNALLYFYDASSVQIGSGITGTGITDTTTGWTVATVTGFAPVNAAYVRLAVQVTSAAAAEVHYVDAGSLRHGTGTDFVAGGTAETNNARTITVAAIDINGEALSSGTKSALDSYLQSLREVNFIVNVVDPIYTTVDVTTQVRVVTGFDPPTVVAAVSAALTSYLSPGNWGQAVGSPSATGSGVHDWVNSNTVRKYEVSQVINDVDGVDYIMALTLGRSGTTLTEADVSIGTGLTLTRPGTITVTTG